WWGDLAPVAERPLALRDGFFNEPAATLRVDAARPRFCQLPGSRGGVPPATVGVGRTQGRLGPRPRSARRTACGKGVRRQHRRLLAPGCAGPAGHTGE